MSTTVTYKGSTLTTVNNQTRVMKTAGKYMEDDVTLIDITSAPVLQSKIVTITPTTSPRSQTVTPDAGNDGLSQVTINVDAVPTGSEGTPIATKGIVSNHSVMITPSVVNSQGYIPGGTRTGNPVTVSASELVGGNKAITDNGTNIDVTNYATVSVNVPTPAPTLQTISKTYTPTESQQTETITPGSGYDGIGEVDVTVNAISSTYVGTGITRRSSSDLTASGATVTTPAGYYASAASKSVASGTAGTPTATKSAVSNHAVTVTPSVTNTTGYITGSTKTGTGVSVSASELVSGSQTITENGTIDVTNLAEVVVNIDTSPKYTATISGTGSSYTYAQHDSVTYYTDGESFEFAEGDTILLRAEGMRAGGSIVIDGVTVAQDNYNRVSYNYTAPANDITISLEYLSQGSVTVETQGSESITVEPLSVTTNGTYTAPSGTAYSPVTVNVPSGKNVQAYIGYDDVASSSYIATDVSVTVAKTGTYQVSWVGWRTTTSGTSGSRLYVNGVATGNAVTTFTGTYGQLVVQTNVSLEEGDVVVVRARSRNTSYRMYVSNLIIEEE